MKQSVLKKIAATATAAMLSIGLVACGNSFSSKIDISLVSEEIMEGVNFSQTLVEIEKEPTLIAYDIDEKDVEDVKTFVASNGMSIDQLSVWKATSVDSAKKIKDKIKIRLAEQTESAKSNKPDEATKLDNAVLALVGNCVVVCVSDDKNAEQVIIEALKQHV